MPQHKAAITQCTLSPKLSVSRIITGLWQIADEERKGASLESHTTDAVISQYLQNGYTTFDMADHYGSAEIITGSYKKRNSVADMPLLTKWVPTPGKVSRQDVFAAVRRSLDRLQSSKIDLLQFHAWNYSDPNWLDCLFWLTELKEEGLIGDLGLTNFDSHHLRIAITSGIPIVSNQVSYSLLDQRASTSMTETCNEFGVKILAFGILAGGFLSDQWMGREEPTQDQLSTWSQMKYFRYIQEIGGWEKLQSLLHVLHDIAIRYNVSSTSVAANYMMNQPAVGAIIIGSRLQNDKYVEKNQEITKLELEKSEIHKIQESINHFRKIPGNCGDEYRKPPFLTASGDLSHHLSEIPKVHESIQIDEGSARVDSGTIWEDIAGFCRARRVGNRIWVSGTTATHGNIQIGGDDPAAQAHFIIDKIKGAIESLGGSLQDVVKTTIYIDKKDIWEPVARAHGARFDEIRPANTMVCAGLIGDGYLVEIEAEAIIAQ